MNNKHAAICRLTFYEVDGLTMTSAFGSPVTTAVPMTTGVILPVSAAELSEKRQNTGSFVEMQFKARLTDTSLSSEKKLISAAYRYGVCILDYTDGSRRLLGTNRSPIVLTYEKSGIHSAFELSISSYQPEFSKNITS